MPCTVHTLGGKEVGLSKLLIYQCSARPAIQVWQKYCVVNIKTIEKLAKALVRDYKEVVIDSGTNVEKTRKAK